MTKFYDHTDYPSNGARGASEALRSEFQKVELGFDQVEITKADKSEIPDVASIESDIAALQTDKENASNKSNSDADSASTTKFPVWAAVVAYFSASRIKSILGISTLSGSNTGDETTATIQTKRPLKTVNGTSLEGTGDVTVSAEVTLGANTFTGAQTVPDEAYSASGWNGNNEVPTKNAVRDVIESLASTIASLPSLITAAVDTAFASTSDAGAVSAAWVKGWFAATWKTSGEKTFAWNTLVTHAHSYGSTPKEFKAVIIVKTTHGTLIANQVYDVTSHFAAGNYGHGCFVNATNIYWNSYLSGTFVIDTAGSAITPDPTKCKLIFYWR